MGETMKIVLFSAGALLIGLIVGAIIGILYRKKVAEAQIGSAEEKAKKIIADSAVAVEIALLIGQHLLQLLQP